MLTLVLCLMAIGFAAGWLTRHALGWAIGECDPVPPTEWACCQAALRHLYEAHERQEAR